MRIAALLLVLAQVSAAGQEWSRFRGPNGSGISAAKGIPVQYRPGDENWKVKLPGRGHSSPIAWAGRIYITSADEQAGRWFLTCLDARDGKPVWQKEWGFKPYRTHQYNTMASSTPCADAQGVYLTWSTHEFFRATALDHAGKELWTTEMGAYKTQHGGAASPIVVDDMVIVAVEQEDLSGYLAGLDRSSGKVLWKRERGESQPTPYSTPLVYQPKNGLKQLLCTSTAYGITSLDPKTGKTYWETGSLFKLRTVGSPVLIDDLVVLGCGSGAGGNHAFAVRLPAQPEGKPEVVSKMLRGTAYVPTGVASDDRLYFWGDNGIVSCLDPKSGEVAWSERAAERTFGSPVLIDGKLYAISAKGELVVAEVGESFKLLGKSDLGEPSHSTPAVAGGVLYLRTETQLISLGGKKRSEGAG